MFRTRRLLAAAVTAVALTVGTAGCGGHDMSASGNSTDAMFVDGMIPHHESAIEMAKLAETRAEHPEIRRLAKNIIASQSEEITQMKRLKDELPDGDHMGHDNMGMSDHAMGMDGDVSELKTAKPFDKAFIDMMVPHHEGAVRMATMLLKNGELPELQTMARAIIKAQETEIQQMRSWRKAWYGSATVSGSGAMDGSTTMDDDR